MIGNIVFFEGRPSSHICVYRWEKSESRLVAIVGGSATARELSAICGSECGMSRRDYGTRYTASHRFNP